MCLATSNNLYSNVLKDAPKRISSHALAIIWSNDEKTHFSILHHLSPVIFANAAVVAFVQLHDSRFRFHCSVKQRLLKNRPGKWQLRPFATSCAKDYEGHSLVQTSFAKLHIIITNTAKLVWIIQAMIYILSSPL